MWWGIAIVLVVLGISAAAKAETLKDFPREETPETWEGRKDPPEHMKPRPKFKVGQTVTDSSSSKSRKYVIDRISGYKNKHGKWSWEYTMTNNTIFGEKSLRAAT